MVTSCDGSRDCGMGHVGGRYYAAVPRYHIFQLHIFGYQCESKYQRHGLRHHYQYLGPLGGLNSVPCRPVEGRKDFALGCPGLGCVYKIMKAQLGWLSGLYFDQMGGEQPTLKSQHCGLTLVQYIQPQAWLTELFVRWVPDNLCMQSC